MTSILLYTIRACGWKRRRRYKMLHMTTRNTRTNAMGSACSKSMSALKLCVRGYNKDVRLWMMRVFNGNTTTVNRDSL